MKYTIEVDTFVIYKEKRSEFIGYVKQITKARDTNNFVKILKSQYPSSGHICYGYRLLENDQLLEYSTDAGEPSGSAGLPILNVLKQSNIFNCSIFVVRLFGGIKLGKPGLINAYKTTAERVIDKSKLRVWIPQAKYLITADIKFYGIILQIVQKYGKIIEDKTSNKLNLLIEISIDNINNFESDFGDVTHNSGMIKKQSELDQTKEVRK